MSLSTYTASGRSSSIGLDLNQDCTSESPECNVDKNVLNATMTHKLLILVTVVAPFLGCVLACFFAFQFGWCGPFYLTLAVIGWLATGLGITVGYHRLLTHRAFDTYDWHRVAWAVMGALAIEGPPLAWCAVHRRHHQHSDGEGDPHSPHLGGDSVWATLRGLWHAHVGWLFQNHFDAEVQNKYIPDMAQIKGLRFITRHYLWFVVASLLLPGVVAGIATMTWTGALLGFLWGGLARVFITHHITWSVNSLCHLFGSRDYHTDDESRNNFVVGLLGHGEGWHNNHHAFPTSARHGLEWWQVDVSWLTIQGLRLLGLAWDIQTPSAESLAAKKAS